MFKEEVGKYIKDMLEVNHDLIDLEFGFNDF